MASGFQLIPGTAPLRLGAYGEGENSQPAYTKYCLDGDLAMPVIYNYDVVGAPGQLNRYTASL